MLPDMCMMPKMQVHMQQLQPPRRMPEGIVFTGRVHTSNAIVQVLVRMSVPHIHGVHNGQILCFQNATFDLKKRMVCADLRSSEGSVGGGGGTEPSNATNASASAAEPAPQSAARRRTAW